MATAMNSLRALADKKTAGVSKDNVFKVDPRIIKIEQGFNVRYETPARRAYIDGLKLAKKGPERSSLPSTFGWKLAKSSSWMVTTVFRPDMELIAEGRRHPGG